MKRITALADCNNFFVSCELLRNPSLKGRPVCVLSNCDGCIISRSNEAKQIGIKMGMPLFVAKKEFPDAVYLSGNLQYYHEISKKIQKALREFSPKIEVYSIDEAFLDVTNLYKTYGIKGYSELGEMLHQFLYKNTGIPVSVGIANSKILCKIAADKAKCGQNHYYISFENIEEEISDYKIEDIWGIGRNTLALLRSRGIYTAGDILKMDKEFFQHYMGKRGLELKFGLAGEDVLPVNSKESKPKSIQKTSSFEKFTNSKEFLKKEILLHLHNACRKMRKYGLLTTQITVMLRTKDFKILYASEIVENATGSELLLNKKVINLFEQIYTRDNLYRSTGVYASGLKDEEARQLSLFENTAKFEKIARLWDKIESRYGRGVFSIGDCRNLINLTQRKV